MVLVMKKADSKKRLERLRARKSDPDDDKLEHFRKLILDHLDTLDDNGKEAASIQKAFNGMILMAKGGKGLPVGTIREWKGKKFVKVAPGKWRPKYDGESRGAKLAVSAIRRKVDAAKTEQELMQICLEHRDRFSDAHGQPLPFVMELSRYVAERGDEIDRQEAEKEATKIKENSKADSKKREQELEIDKKRYSGGSREHRLGIVKDDYIGGKISKDAAAYMYTKIFPKMTENYARKIITSQWDDGKGGGKGGISKDKREEIKRKLEDLAVPMDKREFTHEEYKKLFPRGTAKTPLETVKLGEHQFEKLQAKNREKLLGPMYQTLTDPIVVLPEMRDDKETRIYIKSFKDKKESKATNVISVVVDIDNQAIGISTGERTPKQIEKKIKMADRHLYIKGEAISPTTGNETESASRENDDTQQSSSSPETEEKSSDLRKNFEKIREKYRSAKAVEGDEDEIQVGKETIAGRWKLVDADTPAASHDEQTFHKTKGFPANADGSTINDRDYEHDKEAQQIVLELGGDFDGQAVSVDNPVVVSGDGIVISGNNRTMSSKIAARKGTDKSYIEALKKKSKKFGFTSEQIGEFKHPRVIFETSENNGYSTGQFAKFNQSSKKAMNPIESAVKVSKLIDNQTVSGVAGKIAEFETLGELYASSKASNDIFDSFQKAGIISSFDRPQYITEDGITGAGKEFMETVLIGSVVNETNIRGLNREGCKSVRQKLVRAITPLIENRGMSGYSIIKELNEAVDISMQVAMHRDKFKDVDDFSKQQYLFGEKDNAVAIEIAKKLEGTQKSFAEFMQTMNGGLKYAANGEADIFLGGVETREEILGRMLSLKKAIGRVIDFFRALREGNGGRFVKKAVPVLGEEGKVRFDERWVRVVIENTDENTTEKSLTWSGYPLQGRTKIQGMDISIENKKGSVRSGTDKDGHEWHTNMNFDYGYIRGTVGKDKDHLDVYLGPNPESETVYVIHQNDPITRNYDEDKVMLGFDSAAEAKKAYLSQYDRPDFFGSMDVMDVGAFKEKVVYADKKGIMIKGAFAEGEHPRDGGGRFSESGGVNNSSIDGKDSEKWFRHVLTENELRQFIQAARKGEKPGNALIGIVSDSTKEKVKELTGIDVTKIVLEGTSVIHADDQKHNLEADDIEKSVGVINNPVDVKLSSRKTGQGLNAVIFEGNINGKIFFVEAVHKKNDGWLSLKTAYRPKKASSVPHWPEDPGANAQNDPSPAF